MNNFNFWLCLILCCSIALLNFEKSKAILCKLGKGAPAVNLFLNLPGPPGSQLKINVYVQQFT